MDKKSAMRRAKRQSKVLEDNFWDCSVCTYRNTAEAFKCLMCDVRKGTSTRKPRLNQAMVAQQAVAVAGSNSSVPAGSNENNSSRSGVGKRSNSSSGGGVGGKMSTGGVGGGRNSSGHRTRGLRRPARLRDIDRSSAQAREVTVNSVTVVITEYKRRTPQQNNNSDNDDSSDTRP